MLNDVQSCNCPVHRPRMVDVFDSILCNGTSTSWLLLHVNDTTPGLHPFVANPIPYSHQVCLKPQPCGCVGAPVPAQVGQRWPLLTRLSICPWCLLITTPCQNNKTLGVGLCKFISCGGLPAKLHGQSGLCSVEEGLSHSSQETQQSSLTAACFTHQTCT